MCVMSAVYDDFAKRIPEDWQPVGLPYYPSTGIPYAPPPIASPPSTVSNEIAALRAEVAALRQVVEDFKEAVKAATTLDRLMKQPDCVDPAKKSLDERVAELERRLNAATRALTAPA